MFIVRYVITVVAEFVYELPRLEHIQVERCRKGSLQALFAWCHGSAVFSARYQHPLWVCLMRHKLQSFMDDCN